MMGYTHLMYGILLAEIIWVWKLQNTPLQKQYNRITCWILAMLGSLIPDMDAISSVFSNLTYEHYPWGGLAFEIYHRTFSHSLVFLLTTIFIVLFLARVIPSSHPDRRKMEYFEIPLNPLGKMNESKDRLPIFFGFIFVCSFLLFNIRNEIWMNFALGMIIVSMILFAWSFIKINKPYYAIYIFSAAILHQICDFVNCEWNPYGPWDPTVLWGLFLYCGGCNYCPQYGIVIPPTPMPQFWIMFWLFEGIPPIIVFYRVIMVIKRYRQYKRLESVKTNVNLVN